VKPGETAVVELGGKGRALLGQIAVAGRKSGFDFSKSQGQLMRRQARPIDLPRTVRASDFASDEAYQQAARNEAAKLITYWQSAEGLNAWREHRIYAVWFDADGAFHADDIPAGDYELNLFLLPDIYSASITVPEKNASEESEAANLGTVTLNSKYK
jgi:hypothetical protein